MKGSSNIFSSLINSILNTLSTLKAVAFSGSYNDLSDTPNKIVYYGTCTGQATNQTKAVVVDSSQNFVLTAGIILLVKFDANNTYSATAENPIKLNVNSTGAKNIYYGDTSTPTGTNTTAFGRTNYVNQYYYDGTNWVWSGSSSDNNTTYTNMSASELTTGTATNARSISAKTLTDWITSKLSGLVSDNPTFTEASTRANIASGESFATILGKIKKFFSDLKTVAFTGAYSDLSGTGNVAVKNANNHFSAHQTIDRKDGTSSIEGESALLLGNDIAVGTANNSSGSLYFWKSNRYVAIVPDTLTGNRSIKIPNGNGTFALTSDIPTDNSQLANGAGYITSSGSCASATTASKLGTSSVGGGMGNGRGIRLNNGSPVALDMYPAYCNISSGNKNNYPWHKFAEFVTGTGQYVDGDALIAIRKRCDGGYFGVVKLSIRTNATGGAMGVSAQWIIRSGIAVGDVVISPSTGTTGTSTTFGAYFKTTAYARTSAVILYGAFANGWGLLDSNEVNDTTSTDPKTSVNVYASVSNATSATDTGSVSYATSAGNADTVDSRHLDWGNGGNVGTSVTYLAAWKNDGTLIGWVERSKISVNYANSAGSAGNVTGTVAIANGGTGATTRLDALKNLTNENVSTSAGYFLTITNSWGKGGYTSVADAKTVLGLKSAAYLTAATAATASTVAQRDGSGHLTMVNCKCAAVVVTSNNWLPICGYGAVTIRNRDNSAYIPAFASAFTVNSSRRYKENIVGMTEEDAKALLSLRPVTFDYKEGIVDGNRTGQKGLIAEEVAEIETFPVVYNQDGEVEGLDYSKFVPQLIKLCQMQQKQIDDLTARLEVLESRMK